MRRNSTRIPLSFIAIALVVSNTFCRKTSGTDKAEITIPPVDTLAQKWYTTIDSAGTPLPGVILAAPFNLAVGANIDSPGVLLMMNQDGQILRKLATPGPAFDFNKWVINGQTRY